MSAAQFAHPGGHLSFVLFLLLFTMSLLVAYFEMLFKMGFQEVTEANTCIQFARFNQRNHLCNT